jgi:RNA polymerase sigma-70 factor (ECF subfamily)
MALNWRQTVNEVYRDIEQHIPYLRRYAGALARNPATADDLVQDCVLNALSKSHLYKPGTNLRAWLFTILRNQHISDIRRSVRTGVSVDPDDAAPALATRPNQENNLTVNAVEKALGMLPAGHRILIERDALDGQSYEEVAKSYRLALGTFKSRISRGRSELRKT